MEGGDIIKSEGYIGVCCGDDTVIMLAKDISPWKVSCGYIVKRIHKDDLKAPYLVNKWVYGMRNPEAMIEKAENMIGETTFGIDSMIEDILYDRSCIIL